MMKKRLILCLGMIACILMCSCNVFGDSSSSTTKLEIPSGLNEAEHNTEEYCLPDPALSRNQDRSRGRFLETEQYYFYYGPMNDHMVYISQKEDPHFYPLCAKPDCAHNDENCNAWCGSAMGYWEGRLYGVTSSTEGFDIIQIDMNGTNHQKIGEVEIPLNQDGSRGGSFSFQFHNGYLYYIVDTTPRAFFRFSISERKTVRLLRDLLENGSGINRDLIFDRNHLYLRILSQDQTQHTMYRYNMSDDSIERLCDWPSTALSIAVENGIIRYYDNAIGAFCAYDPDQNTFSVEAEKELGNGAAYFDSDYIYLVTWETIPSVDREFYIFNRSYELLDHISMKNHMDFICAAGDKLFFTDSDRKEKVDSYLLRSDIGKGEAALQRVVDPATGR